MNPRTHILSGPFVNWDDSLHAQLDARPRPDDTDVSAASGPSGGAAIDGCLEVELRKGNHAVQRRRKPEVSDVGLEIQQAVLNDDTPVEKIRMAHDRDLVPTERPGVSAHRNTRT